MMPEIKCWIRSLQSGFENLLRPVVNNVVAEWNSGSGSKNKVQG